MPISALRILAQVLLWLSVTWAGIGVVATVLDAFHPPVDLAILGITLPLFFGAPAAAGFVLALAVSWLGRRLGARRSERRAERRRAERG